MRHRMGVPLRIYLVKRFIGCSICLFLGMSIALFMPNVMPKDRLVTEPLAIIRLAGFFGFHGTGQALGHVGSQTARRFVGADEREASQFGIPDAQRGDLISGQYSPVEDEHQLIIPRPVW